MEEELESNTLVIEDQSLRLGFIQLPKLILYATNLTRDAKLLYAILLGYAWQERKCFPGYARLCSDMGASENMVRKYMRELEASGLLTQKRRGLGKTNIYTLKDLRTSKIEVQEPQFSDAQEPAKSEVKVESVEVESERIDSNTRRILKNFVEDFSREMGDEAPLASSVTRACNLYVKSDLPVEEFTKVMYEARKITKKYTANIKKKTGEKKNKMPYFFSVLEDKLKAVPE